MINRCICINKTFEEILKISRNNNWNIEKLEKEIKCGTKCKLCKPYIEKCITSGITEFPPQKHNN